MFLGTMSLSALNRPKDAFRITVVAAIANILLDLALIPLLGITGAAVATLVAMTLNAGGALILLSRIISIKFEYGPVRNILSSAVCMGIFLLAIHFLLPLTHVAAAVAVVIAGAGIYLVVLLRLDREIHDELKNLSINLGFPWPEWL
jgi:O-antigen/teichoic acid export membrane protein